MEASGCRKQGAIARRSSPRLAKTLTKGDQDILAINISNLNISGPQRDESPKLVEHISTTSTGLDKRITKGDDIDGGTHEEIKRYVAKELGLLKDSCSLPPSLEGNREPSRRTKQPARG